MSVTRIKGHSGTNWGSEQYAVVYLSGGRVVSTEYRDYPYLPTEEPPKPQGQSVDEWVFEPRPSP